MEQRRSLSFSPGLNRVSTGTRVTTPALRPPPWCCYASPCLSVKKHTQPCVWGSLLTGNRCCSIPLPNLPAQRENPKGTPALSKANEGDQVTKHLETTRLRKQPKRHALFFRLKQSSFCLLGVASRRRASPAIKAFLPQSSPPQPGSLQMICRITNPILPSQLATEATPPKGTKVEGVWCNLISTTALMGRGILYSGIALLCF